MTKDEIRDLLITLVKDAVLAECDGTWESETFDHATLYEKHGKDVEAMAERMAKMVVIRFLLAWEGKK